MNRKQLQKLGVPPDCAKAAIVALGRAADQGTGMGLKGQRARQIVADVVGNPLRVRGRSDLGRAGAGAVGRGDPDGPRADQLPHLGQRHRRSGPRPDAAGLPGAECRRPRR